MKKDIIITIRLVVVSILVCCVVYPAVLLAFGKLAASDNASGSLLRNAEGQVVGSSQIAQAFTQPKYFWPRPSACDYNASAASGSNLSPTNPAVTERATGIIAKYGLAKGQQIPADLVTTSGSGLDPHITLAAARFQAERIAAARTTSVTDVNQLIDTCVEVPVIQALGGEPVVNVLLLNIELDKAIQVPR